MADLFFALIAILAFGSAFVNIAYVIKHRGLKRSRIRGIQGMACGFVGVVTVLDASHITDMTNISGWLLLMGLAMVLAASLGEGIIDL